MGGTCAIYMLTCSTLHLHKERERCISKHVSLFVCAVRLLRMPYFPNLPSLTFYRVHARTHAYHIIIPFLYGRLITTLLKSFGPKKYLDVARHRCKAASLWTARKSCRLDCFGSGWGLCTRTIITRLCTINTRLQIQEGKKGESSSCS